MDDEVVIAGGSFAGLAVAAQLRGRRVLLVEPHAIGRADLGLRDAAGGSRGNRDHGKPAPDSRPLRAAPAPPHRGLCPALPLLYVRLSHVLLPPVGPGRPRNPARFGFRPSRPYSLHYPGGVRGRDTGGATGWRAALGTNSWRQTEPHRGKSFGLETAIPIAADGLHFYYDSPRLRPHNVGWLFPTGAFASYRGHTRSQ